jgi:hypothetical protein
MVICAISFLGFTVVLDWKEWGNVRNYVYRMVRVKFLVIYFKNITCNSATHWKGEVLIVGVDWNFYKDV